MSNEEKSLEQLLEDMRKQRNKLDDLFITEQDSAPKFAKKAPPVVEEPKEEKPLEFKVQEKTTQIFKVEEAVELDTEEYKEVVKPKEQKRQLKPKKEKKPNKSSKKIILALVAIVIIGAIIFGIVSYSKVAYLKSYEAKYGVDFPKGIPEEFCDSYGKNQNFNGKLSVLDKNIDIFSSKEDIAPHFENGSDVAKNQQLKAICLKSNDIDLETAFKSANDYEKNNQKVEFKDIYGNTNTYQVIASYYVNTNPADDNDYVFPYYAYGDLTDESFGDFEDKISSRSLFKSGYDMSHNDSYLTLSVDTNFMTDFRFVVLCVKVEGEFVQIKGTKPNDSVRYPQVWYDANMEHNPYWLGKKWQPIIYTDENKQATKVLE